MIGETPIYQREEKSRMGIMLIAIGVILIFGALFFPPLEKNTSPMLIPVSAVVIVIGYLTSRLYILGYFDRLVVRFGKFGPLKVTVPYPGIRKVEIMKIPFIMKWQAGLRVSFGGWFFNPGGMQDAVRIEYGKHKAVIIGTSKASDLKSFLEQRVAQGVKFS